MVCRITARNIVFDLRGCTTLKIGKLSGHIPSITPLYTSRLYWVLIPDPLEIGDVLCKMLALSNGSGISNTPVATGGGNSRELLIPDPQKAF